MQWDDVKHDSYQETEEGCVGLTFLCESPWHFFFPKFQLHGGKISSNKRDRTYVYSSCLHQSEG